MRAAALDQGGSVGLHDLPVPEADGWALVDVRAAGVCGTELHIMDGMLPVPHRPFVLGHEIAGTVREAPAGADVEPGDRVAVYNFAGCGECHWCRTGRDSLCTAPRGQLGFTLDGGFAEVARAPARNLVKLPDNVSFEDAAVLSCSGMTAVHASRLAGVELGQTAVVNGVGGVGLMVIQVLAAAGVRPIGVADAESKAALARAAGAVETIVLPGGEGYETLPDSVGGLTHGAGADHFFELVGSAATMLAGIRCLGRRGTCVLIGYTGEELSVNPVELILSELRIVSSLAAAQQDLRTAIQLAADRRLSATIDTRYPIENVGTALERLRAREVRGRNVLVF
jgi:D-arabinose 1-dehydrogenase-like Zn-dependent alcohol dehydrogenase